LSTLNFGGWSEEPCKLTLLSFNATAVSPHDVMVSENDVLEAGSAVDVFAWLTWSSDCKFELQAE